MYRARHQRHQVHRCFRSITTEDQHRWQDQQGERIRLENGLKWWLHCPWAPQEIYRNQRLDCGRYEPIPQLWEQRHLDRLRSRRWHPLLLGLLENQNWNEFKQIHLNSGSYFGDEVKTPSFRNQRVIVDWRDRTPTTVHDRGVDRWRANRALQSCLLKNQVKRKQSATENWQCSGWDREHASDGARNFVNLNMLNIVNHRNNFSPN